MKTPGAVSRTAAGVSEYQDEVMGQEIGKGIARPGDKLFGRRTWQDFMSAWAGLTDGNPFTAHMNAVTKYVLIP